MVYIKRWTEFEEKVIELYLKAPRKARYVVKFCPTAGKLVLKVTDDANVLMYKSHSSIILNRFETLNHRLLSTITNARRRPAVPLLGSGSAGNGTPMVEGDDPMAGSGAASPAGAPATPKPAQGGAASKKKKKKGKR